MSFNWRQPDWFGALKTGLVPARDDEIDWLENLALEFGWEGQAWRQPLAVPDQVSLTERAEGLLKLAEQDGAARWRMYQHLAAMDYSAK